MLLGRYATNEQHATSTCVLETFHGTVSGLRAGGGVGGALEKEKKKKRGKPDLRLLMSLLLFSNLSQTRFCRQASTDTIKQ